MKRLLDFLNTRTTLCEPALPPKILYKYKKIDDFTIKLLLEDELYFAKPSELGDPNEASFYYKENPIPIREFDSGNITNVSGAAAAKHVSEALEKYGCQPGVLCLTERNDDLLMFDYYADSHKGICIEFSWEKLGIWYKTNNQLQRPTIVQYNNVPLSLSVSIDRNWDNLFNTKWSGYEHEKEWRLFYKPGILKNLNVRKAITGIIFGCKTPEEDKKYLKKCLENRTDFSFYQAEVEEKKYALKIISG
ncbi:MAG: DUF2971 domain-containing protein [Gammaproteobacteria bacterium]|nr:DUF2971 domain-containing protein [Gammaproteobacteria bacterium]